MQAEEEAECNCVQGAYGFGAILAGTKQEGERTGAVTSQQVLGLLRYIGGKRSSSAQAPWDPQICGHQAA